MKNMERTIDPRREWEAELIEVHSKIDNARNILILMRKSGGDSPVIQMNIRHKEEQLRQLLEEEKRLTALLAGKPQEEAAAPETDDGWRSAAQLPEKAGVYRVMRRAIGGRPDYEDKCTFAQGLWRNRTGTVLNSVVKWKEDEGE